MQKTQVGLALCAVLLVAGEKAQAQTLNWKDRGYFGVNIGLQAQSYTFTEATTPVIYGENATITVPHSIGVRGFFDASGGIRVWKHFGIGVGYSLLKATETTTIHAFVPNPIVFNSLREATASTGDLSHTESVIHAQLVWMMPVSEKLHVAAILGPSFFMVKQDLVSGLTTTEDAPPLFPTVTIASVQTQQQSKTAVALTVGADVAYFMAERWGVGGFVRYSRLPGGHANVPAPDGQSTVGVEAGGVQVGLGLRCRF
jgi:opacity protein-like surface antigen